MTHCVLQCLLVNSNVGQGVRACPSLVISLASSHQTHNHHHQQGQQLMGLCHFGQDKHTSKPTTKPTPAPTTPKPTPKTCLEKYKICVKKGGVWSVVKCTKAFIECMIGM